jgi:hypothetical protein
LELVGDMGEADGEIVFGGKHGYEFRRRARERSSDY